MSAQYLCQNKGGEADVNSHSGIRSVTVVEGDQRAAGQLGDLQAMDLYWQGIHNHNGMLIKALNNVFVDIACSVN